MGIEKISVIMPSLNSEKFIDEAIKSCINQKELLELIIIDGYSADNTISIIKKWQLENKKIRLISEKDKGPAEALNKALELTRGEFIAWLNSDDKFENNCFSRGLNYFNYNINCKFLYGHGKHIDRNGQFIEYYPTFEPYVGINHFQNGCFICQPTTLFKKEILNNIGIFDPDLKACFDFDLWLRIFNFYDLSEIGFVNAIQASTRIHDNTITKKKYWRVNLESAIVLDRNLGNSKKHWLEQAIRFLLIHNKNSAIGYLENSDLNYIINDKIKKNYNKLLKKFIFENDSEDYSIVNKNNNYPEILKKILFERPDLQDLEFNNHNKERSFCVWLLNHGIMEYPFLFEGNYISNNLFYWFSIRGKTSLNRIYQTVWDSNFDLQKIWIFRKYKIFLKVFLYFQLNSYISSKGLNYNLFFKSKSLFIGKFIDLIKNKKLHRKKIPISLIGYSSYQSGIGEDLRSTYLAFLSKGLNSRIINFNLNFEKRNRNKKFILKERESLLNRKEIIIICLGPNDCFNYLLSKSRKFFENKYIIGYIPWEFNKWPKSLNKLYKYLDELWSSSEFTFNAFNEFKKTKNIMPLCIDHPEVNLEPLSKNKRNLIRNKYNIPEDNLIFLSSFDLESFIERKNPWAIIKSFQKAFNPNYPYKNNKNVNLLLKTFRPISENRDWEILKNTVKLDDRIIIVEEDLEYKDLILLYGSCDVLVSLHRSEGFGRVIAECIILGLEVITTNWGGITDFCSSSSTHLVPFEISEVIPGTYPFWKNQSWAEPDINKASEYMSEIFNGKRLNNFSFRSRLKEFLSFEKSGERYKKRINQIFDYLS